MPAKQPDPEFLDEHHQAIVTFANTYFDEDEDEREAFVSELMSRRGYKQRTTVAWDPPDPPADPRAGGRGGVTPPSGARQKPAYFRR